MQKSYIQLMLESRDYWRIRNFLQWFMLRKYNIIDECESLSRSTLTRCNKCFTLSSFVLFHQIYAIAQFDNVSSFIIFWIIFFSSYKILSDFNTFINAHSLVNYAFHHIKTSLRNIIFYFDNVEIIWFNFVVWVFLSWWWL